MTCPAVAAPLLIRPTATELAASMSDAAASSWAFMIARNALSPALLAADPVAGCVGSMALVSIVLTGDLL